MNEHPRWAARPVPANVQRAFGWVSDWMWISPLRLRGENPGRGAYLVVIEGGMDEPRFIAQASGSGTAGREDTEVYASLYLALGRMIARQLGNLCDGRKIRRYVLSEPVID
jgi:hypothetical protein